MMTARYHIACIASPLDTNGLPALLPLARHPCDCAPQCARSVEFSGAGRSDPDVKRHW